MSEIHELIYLVHLNDVTPANQDIYQMLLLLLLMLMLFQTEEFWIQAWNARTIFQYFRNMFHGQLELSKGRPCQQKVLFKGNLGGRGGGAENPFQMKFGNYNINHYLDT